MQSYIIIWGLWVVMSIELDDSIVWELGICYWGLLRG